MSLVTIQRSPSPSLSTSTTFEHIEQIDEADSPSINEEFSDGLKSPVRSRSFSSESYLAVKGAALILPQSDCIRAQSSASHGGDIQNHLQAMFYLLRPEDVIKIAVKLESLSPQHIRYMAVVATLGHADTEESVVLGIDLENGHASIGLVLPVWQDLQIQLDGDGGFSLSSNHIHHIFKPVSVQAMWSALQSLYKVHKNAGLNNYYSSGLTHTWTAFYQQSEISSRPAAIRDWNVTTEVESQHNHCIGDSKEARELEKLIGTKLKEIMMTVDLEEVTSKILRTRLEEELYQPLHAHKHYIDEEMIIILRQMDAPSQILPYLYLGSEWNASNLEELTTNQIGFILNVTSEIDNFFSGSLEYYNVRVQDDERSQLLPHWDNTFKFISKARALGSNVLVHCKMGVSRSAATVIAYIMKHYNYPLEEACNMVKQLRSCIKPNPGFMHQLRTYQGILDASKQRHNTLWRSHSLGDVRRKPNCKGSNDLSDAQCVPISISHDSSDVRPKSWSPTELEMNECMLLDQERPDDENQPDEIEEDEMDADHNDDVDLQFAFDDQSDATSLEGILDEHDEKNDELMQPVVLLAKTIKREDIGEESRRPVRQEEPVQEEVGSRREGHKCVCGMYDVSMLQKHLQVTIGRSEDYDLVQRLLSHPDMKIEILLSQQRKNRRIRKMLQRSEHTDSADSESIDDEMAVEKLVSPLPVKVRPDSSWIRVDESEVQLLLSSSQDSSLASSPQPDVIIQYQREAIPWEIGTVRKHTQQMERKSLYSIDTDGESSCDNDSCITEETSVSQQALDEVEPGIVRRTREEIEARNRSQSLIEPSYVQEDCKPLLRTSSLKHERMKRRDRDRRRRQTCLPFLGTSTEPLEKSSDKIRAKSEEPPLAQYDESRVCYMIGSEVVVLEEGCVRKHAQGFESVCPEPSSYGKEEPFDLNLPLGAVQQMKSAFEVHLSSPEKSADHEAMEFTANIDDSSLYECAADSVQGQAEPSQLNHMEPEPGQSSEEVAALVKSLLVKFENKSEDQASGSPPISDGSSHVSLPSNLSSLSSCSQSPSSSSASSLPSLGNPQFSAMNTPPCLSCEATERSSEQSAVINRVKLDDDSTGRILEKTTGEGLKKLPGRHEGDDNLQRLKCRKPDGKSRPLSYFDNCSEHSGMK